MKTTESSLKSILAFLLGAIWLTMLYLGSCKEEEPVSAVLQSRTVKGAVTDSITGDPINGAEVAITSPGGNTFAGSTSNGQFAIQGVPVLPAPQSYQVNVTAVGYESKHVSRNCNCDTLNVGRVPLKRRGCAVQFRPASINFGTVTVGRDSTIVVWMSNPTSLNVIVDSIRPPANAAFILQSVPQTPFTLAPPDSISFLVRFVPMADTKYTAQIQATITCSSAPSALSLGGNGETPKCDFISPSQIEFKGVFVGDTAVAYVIIRNPSYVTPLTIRYDRLPSDPAFKVFPARSPRNLAPRSLDTTFVVFIPPDSKRHDDTLRISTDGVLECVPSVLPCTGNALDLPSIVHGPTMDKWSCPTNPTWLFRGFRFRDRTDVPDSNNFCGDPISCIQSPGGKFGQDSADFRFGGHTTAHPEEGIHAFQGLQKIGNTLGNPLSFTPQNWRNFIRSTHWPQCLYGATPGDVIAVCTREGNFAVIRVVSFVVSPDIFEYQGLVWDYIYPALPPSSSSIRLPK